MEVVFAEDGLVHTILTFFECRERLQLSRVSKQWNKSVNLLTTQLAFISSIRRGETLKTRIQRYGFFRMPSPEDFPNLLDRFPNLESLALYDASIVSLEEVLPKCQSLRKLTLHQVGDNTTILEKLCLLPNPLTKVDIDWGVDLCNSDDISSAMLGPFFAFLEKHGPSLEKMILDGFSDVGDLLNDEQIKKIAALCPKLQKWNMWSFNQTKIATNKIVWGKSTDIQILPSTLEYIIKDATNKTWVQLSSPSLTNITSLSVFGGLTKEGFEDHDSIEEPLPEHQMEVAEVFKNNPNIKFCNLSFYNHQLMTIAPYLKNLTSLFWFASELDEPTWVVLGRELTSLREMKTLDCHRLENNHMVAWVSEMPPGSPLTNLEHRFSSVTQTCVAQVIVPHCPQLCAMMVDQKWDDEGLYAWAKVPNRLYEVEFHEWENFSIDALAEYLKCGGSELVRIDISREVKLSDKFIQDLVAYCPNLADLTIDIALGVSAEGWEALKQFPRFKNLNIGSDTITHELITSCCTYPPTYFYLSPLERKVQAELQKAEAKAEAEARAKRLEIALEWVEAFYERNKQDLATANAANCKAIPNAAVQLLANSNEIPPEMDDFEMQMHAHMKVQGQKLHGEFMRKAAEEKKKLAEEQKRMALERRQATEQKAKEEKAATKTTSGETKKKDEPEDMGDLFDF